MAAAPRFKVFDDTNEYIAAFKYADDAAVLVSARGEGYTIRVGHSKKDIVWHEGQEEFSAGKSYDRVAETVNSRIITRREEGEHRRTAQFAEGR